MNFTKMHGTGNDFIVIEDINNEYYEVQNKLTKDICDRHFGVGGDGVLFVRKSKIADIQMVIINSDGSYASMCGNGIRCFAKYVWENNIIKKDIISIETGDGIKEAYLVIEDNKVKGIKINMGYPDFNPLTFHANIKEEIIDKSIWENGKEYKITSMLMGVPHTVVFGEIDSYKIEEGKNIETNKLFLQNTNVNFCEIVNDKTIKVKTWERGAGATLACGTGCCASVIAANKNGFVGKSVDVFVPGGVLTIEITNEGIFMTGPAEITFSGIFYNSLF